MELDRHFIERNDFSAARRGYDPDEVDRHLREIADAVQELKRSQRRSPSSLAAAAADQVRGIVEAAERSASDIQEQAEAEAKRIVDDATTRARETREKADSDAAERVQQAEQASERLLERTGTVEGEIDRLLGEMRSASGNLVERLRSGASSLNSELNQMREEFASVRESRLETGGAGDVSAPAEPVADSEPEAAEAVTTEGPVDAEATVVAEVEEEVAADQPAVEEEEEAVAEVEAAQEELAAAPPAEEPDVSGTTATGAGGGRSIRGAEGARLIALNMALNGTPREETDRYLAENFKLTDRRGLLDEVYSSVEG